MENQISNTLISNNGHLTKEMRKAKSFYTRGYRTAGKHSGSLPAYRLNLESILWKLIHRNSKSNEPSETKNREIAGEKERTGQELILKNEFIDSARTKLDLLKEEIDEVSEEKADIKKSPEKYVSKDANKFWLRTLSFIIAVFALYLFFFYSSVVYSAFFRVVNIAKDTVFNSIFYPRSFSDAYATGFTALAITVLAPFIFMGIGVIMHKIKSDNRRNKYFMLFAFTSLVFVLDALLAYHISERLHDAKMINSFEKITGYNFWLALADPNFWLIIFFGFVVYFVFGYLLTYFDEEKDITGRIHKLLQNCDDRIALLSGKCDSLNLKIEEAEKNIEELKLKLAGLNKKDDMVTWSRSELKMMLADFTLGWIQFMKSGSYNAADIIQVENDFREFTKTQDL